MKTISDDLAHRTLDLLMHGPSSVAALYASVVETHEGFEGTSVDSFLSVVRAVERAGWVNGRLRTPGAGPQELTDETWAGSADAYRRALPGISIDRASFDPIGVWYEITDAGRIEWELWANSMRDRSGS